MEKRLLPTALYCRLSREDGDRMESDSIGNQRKLLEAYIENHPELVMAECYADDGYTGTNFQRPAFQRMLRNMESGRIRCVLVKDLSRFGRDYIETGRYQKDLLSTGLTTVQTDDFKLWDATIDDILAAYEELDKEGKLNVRFIQQLRLITDAQLEDYLHRHSGRTGDGSEFFKIGAFKLLPDGSLGGKTAALREPYEGDPENKGIFVYDEKVFYDLLEKAYRNGLQLAIHAIGDYTMDVILDCYEKIAAKYPKPDPRFRIIHCQITSEDILDRFARNGVLADIQPLFIRADMEIAEELLGKARVSTSYAWKTMLDKGIHVSGSSDAPVESCDPILAIHCAVTSQNLDGQPAGGWLPQQKLTVQEAVALYTTGSAYTSYEENVKGKLCPGYLADFIVLSQDIFSVPENEIVNTKVEQTYLGGKLVYSR